MANLDLQKYGKKELIQMIMAKQDEIQKLKVEVQAIKTELENKILEEVMSNPDIDKFQSKRKIKRAIKKAQENNRKNGKMDLINLPDERYR